jgi:hypothetical protein
MSGHARSGKERASRRGAKTRGNRGTLDGDFYFSDIPAGQGVIDRRQVLADCFGNIGKGLLFRLALRPAARKPGARNAYSFVGPDEDDLELHLGSHRAIISSTAQLRPSLGPSMEV